jgi:phage tail sheath protein FI
MAKFVSPGVYVIEKDNSQYTPTTGGTAIGIVGFAGKGPLDTPTLITSQQQLVQIFGEPSEDIPGQALEGALEILETTDQVYFVRAAVADATADASTVPVVGSCPTVYVSGVPVTGADSGALRGSSFGIGRDIYIHVQVYNELGVAQYSAPKTFNIPAATLANTGGNEQAHALKKIIGGEMDGDEVSVQFDKATSSVCAGFLVGKYAGSGAYMDVAAFSDAALTTGINVLQPVANTGLHAGDTTPVTTSGLYTSAIRAWGYQYPESGLASSSVGYFVEAMDGGAGYNYAIDALGKVTGNSIKVTAEGGLDMLVEVLDGGVVAENFKTSLYDASVAATFIETSINVDEGPDGDPAGTSVVTSDYIKGNIASGAGVNLDVTAMLTPTATITALGWDPVVHYSAASGEIAGNVELPVSGASYPGNLVAGGYHYFEGSPALNASSYATETGFFGGKLSTTYYSHTGTGGWEELVQHGVHTILNDFKFDSDADKFTPTNLKLVQGTYNMAGGDSGTGSTEAERATALIGSVNPNSTKKTGMQGLSDDSLGLSVALVPGIQTQSVQDNLVTLAETTQNFLALLSCPEAIGGAQAALEFTNGLGNGRTSPLNSSYAAVYFPHLKVFSTYDGKDRFYDPAIYAARQISVTDKVADAWFAPAGVARGRLTKPSDVEVPLSQGDRDALYSTGNVVNPIVKFPKDGIMIFGQRTTQRAPTALDRVNVRRLMIEVRKVVLETSRTFTFEPNDEFTYAEVEATITASLDDIRRKRGITDFTVICNETTNTAARVDRNELWCKILIKPTKTAEILVFEVNLTNQSAKITN